MKDKSLGERVFWVLAIVGTIVGFYMVASPQEPQLNYDIPVKLEALKNDTGNKLPDLSKIDKKHPITLEQFLEVVKKLPEGEFKSNLLFIIAADYNGDSIKLNEILQAYGQLIQAQIKANKSL